MTGGEDQEQECLLLVDDDAGNLQVLYETLDGQAYKLLVARSGQDALHVASQVCPAS